MPFWLRPVSIFGLLQFTMFISSSLMLAIPSSLPPDRLMLAVNTRPLTVGASPKRRERIVPTASDQIVTNFARVGRLLIDGTSGLVTSRRKTINLATFTSHAGVLRRMESTQTIQAKRIPAPFQKRMRSIHAVCRPKCRQQPQRYCV